MAWVVRCCFSAAKGRTPGSGHHKKARKSLTWISWFSVAPSPEAQWELFPLTVHTDATNAWTRWSTRTQASLPPTQANRNSLVLECAAYFVFFGSLP